MVRSTQRAKCKAYDAAVAAGVPAEKRPPEPTAHDRRLAESQAGHLTMNSTYQRERGNPCTSVVDGYEDNLAPCMPHHGSTSTPGGEHHWVYHNEIGQPRCRGLCKEGGRFRGETDPERGQRPPVPPNRYDAAADEADRIRRNPRLQHEPLAPQEGEDQPASNPVQGGRGPRTRRRMAREPPPMRPGRGSATAPTSRSGSRRSPGKPPPSASTTSARPPSRR